MPSLDPALTYAQVVKAGRIRASEFDGLDLVQLAAWRDPCHWKRCLNYDDGIMAVICVPKVSKKQTRYWLWGYRLTVGKIHWQSTKYPLQEPTNGRGK